MAKIVRARNESGVVVSVSEATLRALGPGWSAVPLPRRAKKDEKES